MYDRRVLALLPQFGVAVAPPAAAGLVSRSERSRPRRNRAVACGVAPRRRRSSSTAWPMAPCRPTLIERAARAHRRARAPSAVPGGRACQGAAGALLRAGESGAGAGQAHRRHQRDHRPDAGRRLRGAARQDHRRRARHRSRAARAGSATGTARSSSASARSCRARPTTSSCARWHRCKDRDWRLTIAGPTDRSPEALAALRRGHRATPASQIASRSSAPWHRSAWPTCMRRRTSSSCPRSTRATAWCWPRPWRADCRSSARPAARRPRRCRTSRPSRCRRATRRAHRCHRPRAGRCRPAPAHGRRVLGGRPEAAALGGYGAHHRRRHQGGRRDGA